MAGTGSDSPALLSESRALSTTRCQWRFDKQSQAGLVFKIFNHQAEALLLLQAVPFNGWIKGRSWADAT